MSRRRQRTTTGSTNLLRAGTADSRTRRRSPHLSLADRPRLRRKGWRNKNGTNQDPQHSRLRCTFPLRQRPATQTKVPEYPPLVNIHRVPTPVDYDAKFGFNKIRAQRVSTLDGLRQKLRRSRLPGQMATDVDGDGNIDTTEIRLAAIIRDMEGGQNMKKEDKVRLGRRIMARDLVKDLDDLELKRMGKQFVSTTRDEATELIAGHHDFAQHYRDLAMRKVTAKLQSSTQARMTLQQMLDQQLASRQQHEEKNANHERRIWRAAQSRAAELARSINPVHRFRNATEGFNSFLSYSNFVARGRHAVLKRK